MDDEYEILFEPYPDEELKYFVTEGVDLHTIATDRTVRVVSFQFLFAKRAW